MVILNFRFLEYRHVVLSQIQVPATTRNHILLKVRFNNQQSRLLALTPSPLQHLKIARPNARYDNREKESAGLLVSLVI